MSCLSPSGDRTEPLPRTLRHLVAIVVLPFTVAVLIPLWLARRNASTLVVASSMTQLLPQLAGLGLVTVGVLLFPASLRHFVTEGRGTLAPWDPPRHLVIAGTIPLCPQSDDLGRCRRLLGEALLLLSRPHLIWALIFFGINSVYIPLVESRPQATVRGCLSGVLSSGSATRSPLAALGFRGRAWLRRWLSDHRLQLAPPAKGSTPMRPGCARARSAILLDVASRCPPVNRGLWR